MAERWELLNAGTPEQINFLKQRQTERIGETDYDCDWLEGIKRTKIRKWKDEKKTFSRFTGENAQNKICKTSCGSCVFHITDRSRTRSDSPWSSLLVAPSRWGSVSPAVPEDPLGERRGGWEGRQWGWKMRQAVFLQSIFYKDEKYKENIEENIRYWFL